MQLQCEPFLCDILMALRLPGAHIWKWTKQAFGLLYIFTWTNFIPESSSSFSLFIANSDVTMWQWAMLGDSNFVSLPPKNNNNNVRVPHKRVRRGWVRIFIFSWHRPSVYSGPAIESTKRQAKCLLVKANMALELISSLKWLLHIIVVHNKGFKTRMACIWILASSLIALFIC